MDATGRDLLIGRQLDPNTQGRWVRLETLTRVRWLAATGQVIALLVACYVFQLHFALELCLAVVAVSAVSNMMSRYIHPGTKRLSELELLLTLVFDTTQLALLLFLTGGLNNPFAILLIAPVTIAATTLELRGTLILGALATLLASLLALNFEPLRTQMGDPVLLPDLFRFGMWLALVIGIAFIGLYSRSVAAERHELADALAATSLALAREQKLTDIGGVVAAAAHELGTPLATIKLVSSELLDQLRDDPELADDARLIREQADRCRSILRSMGQIGKDDRHMRAAPLQAVIEEAAAPHRDRGIEIRITCAAEGDSTIPSIQRHPEIIHGLRNLVQNGVDFATQNLWIEASASQSQISIRVVDDGPGYPAHLIGRLGEPFLRRRQTGPRPENRREYEGMGLGLFIAKTLLMRSGARVSFSNCSKSEQPASDSNSRFGAQAKVVWSRAKIEAQDREALGENPINRDTNS